MQKLLSNIISGILGFWLAVLFVPNVTGPAITENWKIFLILGIIFGLANFLVKFIIKFKLLSVIINMAIIWLMGVLFKEITIPFWLPLLEVSLIIWIINSIILKILNKEE